MTETQLIHALHRNHPKGFDYIFNELFPELSYYAGRLIGDLEEAKDIASESLGAFWKKDKTEFNHFDHVRRFLYAVTKNACIDFARKTQTKLKHEAALTRLAFEENDDENILLETEVIKEIFEEIERLPEKCKEVFKLSYIEGLKRSEVASRLNISENTVRNQNIKALHKLRIVFAHKELVVAYLLYLELHEIGFQAITGHQAL